jgi:hypothetical protein
MTLTLSSPAFAEGGIIPMRYTRDGKNVSPPLKWSGVPDNAKSLSCRPVSAFAVETRLSLAAASSGDGENESDSLCPTATERSTSRLGAVRTNSNDGSAGFRNGDRLDEACRRGRRDHVSSLNPAAESSCAYSSSVRSRPAA